MSDYDHRLSIAEKRTLSKIISDLEAIKDGPSSKNDDVVRRRWLVRLSLVNITLGRFLHDEILRDV